MEGKYESKGFPEPLGTIGIVLFGGIPDWIASRTTGGGIRVPNP
jgi:hypothetical protein